MFGESSATVIDHSIDVLSLCALAGVTGKQWQVIARQASTAEGLQDLLQGIVHETHRAAGQLRDHLEAQLGDLERARAAAEEHVASAEAFGAGLVTVRDERYPAALRAIRDRPPFLFFQGDLDVTDEPAIAVVGTRKPSEEGLRRTKKLANILCDEGFVIASGMAAGIDTAAHSTAIARNYPTAAVMGTGILRTYPRENADLRHEISLKGVVLSQFWPDQTPGRATFPMRNVITSGLCLATVVIEASDTSGARLQARIASEQGRAVFLLRSLVEARVWADEMVRENRAKVIDSAEDLVTATAGLPSIETPAPPPGQGRLDVL